MTYRIILIALFFLISACGGGGVGSSSSSGGGNDNPTSSPAPPTFNFSILYDPVPKDSRARYLIDLGKNRPKTTMTNTITKASDVPQSTVDSIEATLQAIADYLGHYDIQYFAYGNTYTSSESVALAYCNLWKDRHDVSEGRGCSRFTTRLSEGLGTGNANAASPGFTQNQDFWANPDVWNNPPNTIEHFVGGWNANDPSYMRVVIHEYVHIHQFRPIINAVLDSNNISYERAMPGWFTEGGAEYLAIVANDEINSLSRFDSEINHNLTNFRQNKHNLASLAGRLNAFGRQQNSAYSDYALGVMAVSHMVSLKGWQVVYFDLINDIYTKGWQKAFEDNMGMTESQFYSSLDTHLAQSDSIVKAAVPNPSNLKNELTPTYPVPRIQLKNSSPTSTNGGGQQSLGDRTIYVNLDDESSTPSYLGTSWPYIKVNSASIGITDITKETEVTADTFTIDSSGQALLANKPIYQYAGDSAGGSASGDGLNDKWYAVLPDGTTTNTLSFKPRSKYL